MSLLFYSLSAFSQPRTFPEPTAPIQMQDDGAAREAFRIARLARTAEDNGNFEHALELWQAVLAVKPTDYSAYRGVQRALIGLKRYQEALDFLDEMHESITKTPGEFDPIMIQADRIEVMLAAGMSDKVETEIATALAGNHGVERIYTEIATVLIGQRRDDEAIQIIQQGRADCGNPYLFAREIARWYEARMNWREAIDEYLLHIEERTSRLNYVTGAIGDLPPEVDSIAIEVITERLGGSRGEFAVTLRRLLAELHFRAKRYQEALEQYKQLDRLGSEPGEELLKFANQLMEEHEYALAGEAFGKLADAQGSPTLRARALLGKGQAAMVLDEIDSARVAFTSLLTPGSPPETVFEAYVNLGDLEYEHGGTPEAARNYYNSALKTANLSRVTAERRDDVKVMLALTWEKDGKPDQAQRELEGIIKSNRRANPAVSAARLELARLAFRRGDIEAAQNQAAALLMSDPSSIHANEALDLQALLFDLKGIPDAVRAFGRADQARFTGNRELCQIILDSLAQGSNPRIVEAALWEIYHLEVERGRADVALGTLKKIIALGERSLRGDLALFTAGKHCEQVTGDSLQAADFYEQLLIEHPDSPLADQARRQLKAIGAGPS